MQNTHPMSGLSESADTQRHLAIEESHDNLFALVTYLQVKYGGQFDVCDGNLVEIRLREAVEAREMEMS